MQRKCGRGLYCMRSRPKGRTAEMGLYIGRLQYVSPTKGKRYAVMTQKHLDQAGAGERAIPMRRLIYDTKLLLLADCTPLHASLSEPSSEQSADLPSNIPL